MMKQFRTHSLAVEFYRDIQNVQIQCQMKDQLLRASASIALNLSEGYGRLMRKDKLRFYRIAFGSIREVQSICEMENLSANLKMKIDIIAAHCWKLIHN